MSLAGRYGVTLTTVATLICCCPAVAGQQEARPAAQEAPLPRKPFFGAQLGPVTKEVRQRQKLDGTEGVVLVQVFPRTTAAEADFKPGDVILSVDGSKVGDIAAFLGKVRTIRTGDTLTVEAVRDGERSIKKLTMREKPRETSDAYDITYGQVRSRGSRLRTIVTRPKAEGRHPAILLLQGYGCGTIDIPVGRPDQLRWLADDLTRHGYVVMRVDRPGSGDSEGGPCQDIDLETELDGYRQALRALKGFDFVDADNVFFFGYSLGGTTAPLIAVDEPVKGIAIYGTGSKTWFEALLEQRRYVMQVDGTMPAEVDRQMNRWGRVFTYLLLEKMKPADVAEKHPDLRDLLKVVGAEGDYINGRHYRFHHQLAERSIDGAWAKVDADVLALWGKSDWACAGYFDEHIARLVNQAHPGRAKFVALERTDHGFYRVASPEDALRLEKKVSQGKATWPEYNPVVLETLRGWLAKETGKAARPIKMGEGAGGAAPAGQPSERGRGGKAIRHWTVLFYGTAFGNDVKPLLRQVAGAKSRFVDDQGVEFVTLLDCGGKYTGQDTGVGEQFEGTRLYRLTRGQAVRLGGGAELPKIATTGEAKLRMGAPATLRQFVRYAKAHYPAEHYALFLYGHGVGRCMCFDRGSGRDALFTAALTEILGREESVDLLVLDVCNGAAIENAYQWRPSNGRFQVDVLVAAPGAGRALPYGRIVECLRKPPSERNRGTPADAVNPLDPAKLTARQFGSLLVAQAATHLRDITKRDPKVNYEAWVCCDLSKAAAVKKAVDALAADLARTNGRQALEAVRGFGDKPVAMNYMLFQGKENDWLYFPYFDLYDLARRVSASGAFPPTVRERAGKVMTAVEAMIVSSFGQSRYKGFQPGKNGVYIVFPDGAALHDGRRHWKFFRWYSPLDVRHLNKDSFGLYAWCKDGATPGNGVVENWFELLDSWYDTTNDKSGGLNGYRW